MARMIRLNPNARKRKKVYYAIVDDEDYEVVKDFIWKPKIDEKKGLIYACAEVRTFEKIYKLRMHRYILKLSEYDHNVQVDHINHNGLDNRKENLRICDGTLNNCNMRKKRTTCSSLYKGVSWDKYRNKWASYIQKYDIKIDIGKWAEEWKAAIAYNFWAINLFREFACLNDVPESEYSEQELNLFLLELMENYNARIDRYKFKK